MNQNGRDWFGWGFVLCCVASRLGPSSDTWKLSSDGSWAKQCSLRRNSKKQRVQRVWTDSSWWIGFWFGIIRFLEVLITTIATIWPDIPNDLGLTGWGIPLFICRWLLAEPLFVPRAYVECRDLCGDASYLWASSSRDSHEAGTSIRDAQQRRDRSFSLCWWCLRWSTHRSSQQSD